MKKEYLITFCCKGKLDFNWFDSEKEILKFKQHIEKYKGKIFDCLKVQIVKDIN